MPGFGCLLHTNFEFRKDDCLVSSEIKGPGYQLNRFTLNKFMADKLFSEDERGIIILEGIVLNKAALMKSDSGKGWYDVVWNLYQKLGNDFFRVFRGTFSGLLYDKSKKKWIIFCDQLGTKFLYYYTNNDVFFLSNDIKDIYDYLQANNLVTKLNLNAAYMLLSYGYMLETNTLCDSIKKILPGNYVVLENGKMVSYQYYKLPMSTFDQDFDDNEVIDTLDKKFREAVALQFEKDKEYGYTHFVSLSAGLDSRMVSWVAHELGYKKQVNFTFSQSGYLDETIPKRIAADLHHEWIFKALDNGTFLLDVEEMSLRTGGNILYFGLAHSNSMYRLIDFRCLGIIHTGQVGDAIIGSIVKNFSKKSLEKLGGAYSEKLIDRVQTLPVHFKDATELEISLLYQRALNGANNGYLSEQWYTETLSPFCDVDFFEYCLSIPINERIHHKLYKKWILKKHPKAAQYIWETTKLKISQKMIYLRIGEKKIPLHQAHRALLRKLGLAKKPSQTRHNMNPLDYWFLSNRTLKDFGDRYVAENLPRLAAFPGLFKDAKELYEMGSATEKTQVLTLLSAVKLYPLC
jgi:asparagine synthase (glutamine-hydrolysing)